MRIAYMQTWNWACHGAPQSGSVCCTSSPADTLPRPQLPVEFLLLLTVPVVDPDKDDRNWKRPLNCLQLVISPLVLVLTLQSGACEYPSPTTALLLPQSLFRGDSRACFSNKGLPYQWSSPAGGAVNRTMSSPLPILSTSKTEDWEMCRAQRWSTCLAAEVLGFMSNTILPPKKK